MELKNDKNIQIMQNDLSNFGIEQDNQLQKFEIKMQQLIESGEHKSKQEFTQLLNESMR